MLFQKTRIEGPRLITLQEHADERGFFARTFCVLQRSARHDTWYAFSKRASW
jgi:dTDP-4-dehydrorhamnose 3,5-epimerase-like enzyme